MANAQANLEILIQARDQASAQLKATVAQLDALRRASANTPLSRASADVRDARNAFREAQQAVRAQEQAIKQHAKAVQEGLTPLRNYRREVGLLIGMLRGSNLLSAVTGNSRLGSLASTRATTVGAAVGFGLAGVGLSFNSLQENITLAFSTMMKANLAFLNTGDYVHSIAYRADAAWTQLLNTARQLPFALSDTLAAGRELFTSGFTMDQATQQLTLIGTALSNLGNYSAQSLAGVSNAFAQMQQTGVFSIGAINQLMAAGVPIISALAKQLGTTDFAITQVLGRLNGKVPSDFWMGQINLALQQFAQNTDGVNTMSASLETLRNNFTTSLGAITKGSFTDAEAGIQTLSNMFGTLTTTVSNLDPNISSMLGGSLIGLSAALGLASTVGGSGLSAAGGILSGIGGIAGAGATAAAGGAESGLLVGILIAIIAMIALQSPWTKMFTDIQTNTKTVADNSTGTGGSSTFTGTFNGTMNVTWGTFTGAPQWFISIVTGAALVVHLWGDWLWSAVPPDVVVNASVSRVLNGTWLWTSTPNDVVTASSVTRIVNATWGTWTNTPPDVLLGNVTRVVNATFGSWTAGVLPDILAGNVTRSITIYLTNPLGMLTQYARWIYFNETLNRAITVALLSNQSDPIVQLAQGSYFTRSIGVGFVNAVSDAISNWIFYGSYLSRSLNVLFAPQGGGDVFNWMNGGQALSRNIQIAVSGVGGVNTDFTNWLNGANSSLSRDMFLHFADVFGNFGGEFINWLFFPGSTITRNLNLNVYGVPGSVSASLFLTVQSSDAGSDFLNWLKFSGSLLGRWINILSEFDGSSGSDFANWMKHGGILNRTVNLSTTGGGTGGSGGGTTIGGTLANAASMIQGVAGAALLAGFPEVSVPLEAAAGTIAGIAALGRVMGVPGFAQGGIVPGPMGAPQLAVVHGGEEVIPLPQAGRGGRGDVHIHNYNPIIAGPSADQWFRQMMDKAWRSGGSPQPA